MLAGRHGSCQPSGPDPANGYRPAIPNSLYFYQADAGNLKNFLAEQQRRGRHVPEFVEGELRSFLECGILAFL
jgi:hypothetical protein